MYIYIYPTELPKLVSPILMMKYITAQVLPTMKKKHWFKGRRTKFDVNIMGTAAVH